MRLNGVFIPDRHIIPSPVGLLSTDNLPEGTPGTRLQRYFRDVQMYRVHFQSQAVTPMLRAQLQLGVEVPLPFRAAAARGQPNLS